jgi:hypothetical protein
MNWERYGKDRDLLYVISWRFLEGLTFSTGSSIENRTHKQGSVSGVAFLHVI